MFRRIWPWVVALAIFLCVGYFVLVSQMNTSFVNAERVRDICYARKGYSLLESGEIPLAVVQECTQPIRDWDAQTGPYFVAAGAGGVAAAIFLGLVLGLRRAMRVEDGPADA